MAARLRRLLVAGLVCALGVVWRMAPLGLPRFALKYGGSALYAGMLYWLLGTVWPRLSPRLLGVVSFMAAAAVEAFKLVHAPALDAFRRTLAGQLTLGRVFGFGALAAYAAGCALMAAADWFYQRTSRSRLK